MHATAFLKKPDQRPVGPMVALFGAERFLKLKTLKALCTLVLGSGEEELGLTRYPGPSTDFSTVMDELRTLSMFGDRRVVLIEEADDFVTKHRAALEKYLDKPAKKGLLVLEVKTWTSSTRLAKKVAQIGLDLDCSPLKPAELLKWLSEHAQSAYGKPLARDAAQTLIELRGNELGHLDQELAKLAAYAGDKAQIDRASVEKLVGGWKAETTWSMLDAVRDGRIIATGTNAEIGQWIGKRKVEQGNVEPSKVEPPKAIPGQSEQRSTMETVVLDAMGKLVIPGFNDSHVHFLAGGQQLSSVQLRDAQTPAEFTARLKEFALRSPAFGAQCDIRKARYRPSHWLPRWHCPRALRPHACGCRNPCRRADHRHRR